MEAILLPVGRKRVKTMAGKTALTLLVLGALAAPALADTITFKNGHEVHGRLMEETDKYVIFQVGNGKLKFDKKEIATFTEDADYGQRYFTPPKREDDSGNTTPGVDGKPGKAFLVPADATPEEKKDLRGVHARIEEELGKLGPSPDERQRRLDLTGTERASLDAAISNLGDAKSNTADFAALGPKCIAGLSDVLVSGTARAKANAAAAISDAVTRGDEGDAKWALGHYKVATNLANVLDASGDEGAADARNQANHALEIISGTSQSWLDTKDPAPTEAQRNATTKWKDWAKNSDASFDAAQIERETGANPNKPSRKTLLADWKELDDPQNWRKALDRCSDRYGTTPTTAGKGGDTTKPEGAGNTTNPEVAKDATPDEQKKLNDAKTKIKKCLDSIVGLSLEERKKKYAATSEERQDMELQLQHMNNDQRRGRNEKFNNAVEAIVAYGLKAIGPTSEKMDGLDQNGQRGAAVALGRLAAVEPKDDAFILMEAYGAPSKILALLDDSSDQARSAANRMEADKALQGIFPSAGVGYPNDVTEQFPNQAENDAKGRWQAWINTAATDFQRTEKAREDHRKVLTELLKKLDSPKSWKDALKDVPGAISKAERDLKKS
jgi:hypothetical protein